jgi:alpha-tubulin suppressor-like RCC1 family protein
VAGVRRLRTTTDSTTPVTVTGITTATTVTAGKGAHSCALNANRTISCWGNNAVGQLGNCTTTNSSTPVTVAGL